MAIEIITPEAMMLAAEAKSFASELSLTISNNADYERASEILKEVKARLKKLDDMRKVITRPLDEAKKKAVELFREPVERLEAAEHAIKNAMLAFQHALDEERQLAEGKAIEEKRKLEAAALKAAAKGDIAKVAQKLEAAAQVVTILPDEKPKVSGVQMRKLWHWRIVDAAKIPREFLVPNEKLLGEIARRDKETARVEGIAFFAEDIIASGM